MEKTEAPPARPSWLAEAAKGLSTSFPAPHFPSELPAGTIFFDSGFAFPGLLPDLTAAMATALTTHRFETLQYAPAQGLLDLRRWIAEYMSTDGAALAPENVLITNGAKHGIELICRLTLDRGDAIVVTAPTYFTAIPIFRSFGAEMIEIAQDELGMRVADVGAMLEQRRRAGRPPPKFIYNVADFHNPSGLTMPEARRRALVELASANGILIVEDTPYRRVRFDGADVPSLKALDPDGSVIHVGTFSKLVAPGLRIGWVAAEADIIARLIQLKSDGGSSPLVQRAILEFCRSSAFAEHVQRVRSTYRAHRDAMIAALGEGLPGAEVIVPEGGYYLWVRLPPHVDGDALAEKAAAAGVNLIPGSRFFAGQGGYPSNQSRARRHVRLSYSYATPEEIADGVRRLGSVYAELDRAARTGGTAG